MPAALPTRTTSSRLAWNEVAAGAIKVSWVSSCPSEVTEIQEFSLARTTSVSEVAGLSVAFVAPDPNERMVTSPFRSTLTCAGSAAVEAVRDERLTGKSSDSDDGWDSVAGAAGAACVPLVGVDCCAADGGSAGATTGLGAVTELEGATVPVGGAAAGAADAAGAGLAAAAVVADAVTGGSFDFAIVARVARE